MPAAFTAGNTLMMDSVVGDKWITDVCRDNPTAMLPSDSRLITTGPCRLSFTEQLFEPRTPSGNTGGTPKFGVCALYTPFTDMSIFYNEYYRVAGEMFPDYFNAALNGYSGLENPFHDCVSKSHKYTGYTPGLTYINHTSRFKPAIVDSSPAKNPITDKARVYPGVWAILVVNSYGYGKSPPQPKKGIGFGLQAVMIIGDDTNLAGTGGVDPREAFKGVNVRPPQVNPAQLAGLVPPGQAPVGPPPQSGRMPPSPFAPPGPPNPLHNAMRETMPASDDPFDTSGIS